MFVKGVSPNPGGRPRVKNPFNRLSDVSKSETLPQPFEINGIRELGYARVLSEQELATNVVDEQTSQ